MTDNQPTAIRISALIISACSAWETVTGRKLDEATAVTDFLQALKSDETLWRHIYAVTRNHPEMREAALQLRETLVTVDYTPATPLSEILRQIGIEAELQVVFMLALNNTASRTEMIKTAFAAKDPATVACLLEQISEAELSQTVSARLNAGQRANIGAWLGTDAGKLTAAGLLVGLLLASYYVGNSAPSAGSNDYYDRPRALSALYKGVTPDLI